MASTKNRSRKKKILIVTDDSGESHEILYAYHRFLEAGHQPVIASTRKKALNAVIHDFDPDWTTYVEKPGYRIESHLTLRQAKARDYEAILLIGGRAPEFLRHDPAMLRLIREFDKQGKWIFAICHGIQILLAAGLGRGRRLTSYCNIRVEVETAGARWINRQSVVDGNYITAQTWESHPEFYRNIFKHFS